MLMGILENVRAKIGSKVSEMQESHEKNQRLNRAAKITAEAIYRKEYANARLSEARKTAAERAKKDAYNRVHPGESIAKRISAFSGSMKERSSAGRGGGNSLQRNLEPLGNFGRSIGRQYDRPGDHLPSALRDFDKPKKRRF